jgi:hypothetical protein
MNAFPEWKEPDPVVVDELVEWGVYGADAVMLLGRVYPSEATRTIAAVRASIRLLLTNGFIRPSIPDPRPAVVLDPPGGW